MKHHEKEKIINYFLATFKSFKNEMLWITYLDIVVSTQFLNVTGFLASLIK